MRRYRGFNIFPGLIMTFLFLCAPVCCRASDGWPQFRSILPSDGLRDALVNVIYPDSAGYVWIGTKMGLDRFDGNRVRSYHFPDGVPDHCRINVVLDMGGKVYVGTQQGLFAVPRHGVTLEAVLPGSIDSPVCSLASGEDGYLWIGSKYGLYGYDTKNNSLKRVLFGHDAMSSSNMVRGLSYDRIGKKVWAVTLSGVCRYDPVTGKTESFKNKRSKTFWSMEKVGNILYIATKGHGVMPFDVKALEYRSPLHFGNDIITSVSVTPDKRLVVASDCEGIFIYSLDSGNIEKHYNTINGGLRSNAVYFSLIDRRGILWVGHFQAGVDYTPLMTPVFQVYEPPCRSELSGQEVRAIAVEDGFKLIGTLNGLYHIDEHTGEVEKFSKPTLASNIVFSIQKHKGSYYIGTYRGGVYVFDPIKNEISPLEQSSGIKRGSSCFDITEDRKGNLWFATSRGVFRLGADGTWSHYDPDNSALPKGSVYDIYFDSKGRGWICSEGGLARFDGGKIRTENFPRNMMRDIKIRDVYEDDRHNLYFAPERGRVIRTNLEMTKFERLSLGEGVDPYVSFITGTDQGEILFGTNLGLAAYDGKDNFRYYSLNEGLPDPVFTYCKPVVNKNGDVWMGNFSGLVRFDSSEASKLASTDRRRVNLTEVVSGGVDVSPRIEHGDDGKKLKLSSPDGGLTVTVSDFSYGNPEYTQFEYRLDGVDKGWQRINGEGKIHYDRLPSGSSMLRVRRAGYPDTETAIDIVVSSGNAWVVAGIVIAGLAICALVYFLMLRSKKTRVEVKRAASYEKNKLPDAEARKILKNLDNIMRVKKPYLNPDLKIADLAELSGASSFALSYLFNQYLTEGYYNYVNTYRVEEFKRMTKEEDCSRYTLSAMALKCGFSSRTSFFRHFKTITGVTPSEYLKGTK